MMAVGLEASQVGARAETRTHFSGHSPGSFRRVFLAIAAVWVIISSLSIWHSTWDDSYILFRYAHNFAAGAGFVYNPGQRVEGYTSSLWVVLLGEGTRLFGDTVLVSRVLGLLLNLAVLTGVYYLCRTLATAEHLMPGAALLLTASNTYFIANGVAGLETPLFTALLCWAVFACLKAYQSTEAQERNRWCVLSSALFALLVMTRPDGALAYLFVWPYAAWKLRNHPRAVASLTLPFVLLFVPYFAWRWHYFGFFFTNTFYAKRGGTLALFSRGLTQTGSFFVTQTGGWFLTGLVGIGVVVFPVVETTVLALACASRIIFELWSGGVTPGEFRFLIPTLPLIWILAERVLLGGLIKDRMRGRALLVLTGVFALILVIQTASFIHYRRQKIEPVQMGMERAHISLGKWLGTHSSPAATVAVGDIGAIGFWSNRRILDLDGLADTHIAHLPGAYGEKRDPQYVLGQSPDFIVLRAAKCAPDSADISPVMDKAIYASPQFNSNYSRVGCWEFWKGYDLVVYQRGGQAEVRVSEQN